MIALFETIAVNAGGIEMAYPHVVQPEKPLSHKHAPEVCKENRVVIVLSAAIVVLVGSVFTGCNRDPRLVFPRLLDSEVLSNSVSTGSNDFSNGFWIVCRVGIGTPRTSSALKSNGQVIADYMGVVIIRGRIVDHRGMAFNDIDIRSGLGYPEAPDKNGYFKISAPFMGDSPHPKAISVEAVCWGHPIFSCIKELDWENSNAKDLDIGSISIPESYEERLRVKE